MDAEKLIESMVEKSVERYQTYAYATGVLTVTVLGLLKYLEPSHREVVLRDLKEIEEKL